MRDGCSPGRRLTAGASAFATPAVGKLELRLVPGATRDERGSSPGCRELSLGLRGDHFEPSLERAIVLVISNVKPKPGGGPVKDGFTRWTNQRPFISAALAHQDIELRY